MSTTESTSRPTHPGRQGSIDEAAAAQLEKKLQARPEKATLVERNILKDDKGVAPSLVAAKAKLEKSQLEDKLEKKLQERPTKEKLQADGILHAEQDEAAASA
uniref:RPEL repeat protein n=1 Tax=Mycena chlorophos TaxID=658473 RepID=A0ABQ0M2W2_MYCCL|nr:predicted protein [Mycena chlorophos]